MALQMFEALYMFKSTLLKFSSMAKTIDKSPYCPNHLRWSRREPEQKKIGEDLYLIARNQLLDWG